MQHAGDEESRAVTVVLDDPADQERKQHPAKSPRRAGEKSRRQEARVRIRVPSEL